MLSADVDVAASRGEGSGPETTDPVVAQRSAYGRQRPAVSSIWMSRGLKVSADAFTVNWQRPDLIARWIEMGADVNAKSGPYGGTPLMRSVSSELATADTVRLLLERGANANAESTEGERPLDWAIYRGDRAKIAILETYGATRGQGPRHERQSHPRGPAATAIRALGRSKRFAASQVRARCTSGASVYLSSHHGARTKRPRSRRSRGIPVSRRSRAQESRRESSPCCGEDGRAGPMQGRQLVPGGVALTVGYGLMALAAERYPLDSMIASHIHWTLASQMPDGSWLGNGVNRPPVESSTVSHTAIAARGLTLYPIPARKPEFDRALRRASEWLVKADAPTAEDRAMKLMGLVWTKAPKVAVEAAIHAIVRQQATRGGWSQLPELEPDAYATGLALVASSLSGMRSERRAYRKGIGFFWPRSTPRNRGSSYARVPGAALLERFPFYRISGFPRRGRRGRQGYALTLPVLDRADMSKTPRSCW